ncbi:MAG TPA: energy transducer TonB [Gammaproteobacteria bacterium]
MQYLIASADRSLDEAKRGHLLDFVRVKREEVVERKQEKPDKPPPPEAPPPEPPTPQLDDVKPNAEKIAVRAAPVETEIDVSASGFSLGIGDGEYLPIVKVAPIYPRRALSRGIEGHVIVEFTVTKLGTVRDVRVVESEPSSGIFNDAAVAAAEKFKYKPRVIDGQAVEVPGVQNKLTFKIEK